jgi:hypothetical protein
MFSILLASLFTFTSIQAATKCAEYASIAKNPGKQVNITFIDDLGNTQPMDLCWSDTRGIDHLYKTFSNSDEKLKVLTYENHPWILRDKSPLGPCTGNVRAPSIQFDENTEFTFSKWLTQCGLMCLDTDFKATKGPRMTFDVLNDQKTCSLDLCWRDSLGSFHLYKKLTEFNEITFVPTFTRRQWALFNSTSNGYSSCQGGYFVKPFAFAQSMSTRISELKRFCSGS